MHLHVYWKMILKMKKKGEAKLMQIPHVKYEYPHRKQWLVDENSGQKNMCVEESDDAASSELIACNCKRA